MYLKRFYFDGYATDYLPKQYLYLHLALKYTYLIFIGYDFEMYIYQQQFCCAKMYKAPSTYSTKLSNVKTMKLCKKKDSIGYKVLHHILRTELLYFTQANFTDGIKFFTHLESLYYQQYGPIGDYSTNNITGVAQEFLNIGESIVEFPIFYDPLYESDESIREMTDEDMDTTDDMDIQNS